jgi:hypothetical protein
MTRKRDVVRPYPPDYCSRETLAYRLDCSIDKINKDVRLGLLPPSEMVGHSERWHWPDVVVHIKARNGLSDDYLVSTNGDVHRLGDEDPYSAGVKRVATVARFRRSFMSGRPEMR